MESPKGQFLSADLSYSDGDPLRSSFESRWTWKIINHSPFCTLVRHLCEIAAAEPPSGHFRQENRATTSRNVTGIKWGPEDVSDQGYIVTNIMMMMILLLLLFPSKAYLSINDEVLGKGRWTRPPQTTESLLAKMAAAQSCRLPCRWRNHLSLK